MVGSGNHRPSSELLVGFPLLPCWGLGFRVGLRVLDAKVGILLRSVRQSLRFRIRSRPQSDTEGSRV